MQSYTSQLLSQLSDGYAEDEVGCLVFVLLYTFQQQAPIVAGPLTILILLHWRCCSTGVLNLICFQAAAVLYSARHEHIRNRTRERALLLMQQLVETIRIADTAEHIRRRR